MTDFLTQARQREYDEFAAELERGFAALAYCLEGGYVGQFLTAVMDNDLREAVGRGDDNSLAGLKPIIQLLYNYAPGRCHGSKAIREAWQEKGGVKGRSE